MGSLGLLVCFFFNENTRISGPEGRLSDQKHIMADRAGHPMDCSIG